MFTCINTCICSWMKFCFCLYLLLCEDCILNVNVFYLLWKATMTVIQTYISSVFYILFLYQMSVNITFKSIRVFFSWMLIFIYPCYRLPYIYFIIVSNICAVCCANFKWPNHFLLNYSIFFCWMTKLYNLNFIEKFFLINKLITLSHVCACPKQTSGFPASYVVVFLCSVSQDEKWLFVLWNWWPSLFKLSFHNNWMLYK